MKHTSKKDTHLINDLHLLVRKLEHTRKYDLMLANRKKSDCKTDHASLEFFREQGRLFMRVWTAKKKWKNVPKERRDRAANAYRIANTNATLALDLDRTHSADRDRKIIWRGRTEAKTIQTPDKVGGNFQTAHIIRLEAAGVLLMEKLPQILSNSAQLGLPVIALFRVPLNPGIFNATWVTIKAGKIKSVEGWIAYDRSRNLICHSTVSVAMAKEGLRRVVAFSKVK